MKNLILTLSILSSAQILAFDNSPKKELLQDVKVQTKKCTVQIVAVATDAENEKVIGYKSKCKELKILSPREAMILIEGEWLTATITEASESDGGDLDDLTITNSKGVVLATKTNIAAYESVLVAMAGDANFRKIHIKN